MRKHAKSVLRTTMIDQRMHKTFLNWIGSSEPLRQSVIVRRSEYRAVLCGDKTFVCVST